MQLRPPWRIGSQLLGRLDFHETQGMTMIGAAKEAKGRTARGNNIKLNRLQSRPGSALDSDIKPDGAAYRNGSVAIPSENWRIERFRKRGITLLPSELRIAAEPMGFGPS
ncbi:hypothetical protein CLIM01_09332 [Colletotrichum limetticola]|uniref:Uncharacterized protein n=1 Tax=Colletotrichum limetticola TaxID=1209924 RepID=A0ABQ9PP62_9PEZI|nr:hypothetical protein CLIM01_09332 [Colletotrichum limetticola]